MPLLTAVGGYDLGELVIEGKTKQVYNIKGHPDQVLVISKDRITAGDGVKAHDLEGKAAISTKTTCKVFEILKSVGIKTSYVEKKTDTAFVARKCDMIPIEWVTRRIATGSFLKGNPAVKEGFRFNPILSQTFFKDDANHDPQWSEQQIISAGFCFNGVKVTKDVVDIIRRTSILVFEVLEKLWASRECTLVDMKVEFGIDTTGDVILSDVIDSDSWRLWPSGDKRLMKDKQVYRNLTTVTAQDLDNVKRNFTWVADQLDLLDPPTTGLVVVLMGSPSDKEHCQKIERECKKLHIPCELRVTSAHKGTETTLQILAEYEGSGRKIVFVAVAGRSNGLGPVLSGNSVFPVINCPPVDNTNVWNDIWSSLNTPSGLGCTTVIYPTAAAIAAAQILALDDHILWARLRTIAFTNYLSLKCSDMELRKNSQV